MGTEAMSRLVEYLGPTIVDKEGATVPDLCLDKEVVGLVFATNSSAESMQWIRDELTPLYRTVKASAEGSYFECVLVCPDKDDADYAACAAAVPCHALPKGDVMIKNLITMHRVQQVPSLVVLAGDGTEITVQGVMEMNPPEPQQGRPPPPPQLAPVDLCKSWKKR